MWDHRYITFTISKGDTTRTDVNTKRIAWSTKRFDNDLFHSVLIWECPQFLREDVSERSPQDVSVELDSIMRRACDAAMPRQSLNFRKKDAVYWWSAEISDKRRECIQLRRKWKRVRGTADSDVEKMRDFKTAKRSYVFLYVKQRRLLGRP